MEHEPVDVLIIGAGHLGQLLLGHYLRHECEFCV